MTKPMPQLIGISGYARSGKDTFAAALAEGRGYSIQSFSRAMKDLLLSINPSLENGLPTSVGIRAIGEERLKDLSPEFRRLQQQLGTNARTVLGDGVWVEAAMRLIDGMVPGFPKQNTLNVFKDVRFHNEAQAIVDRGGIIVRIERDGVGPCNDHRSEVEMDDWSYDYVVRNNWTVAELRQRAFDVIDKETGAHVWSKVSDERLVDLANKMAHAEFGKKPKVHQAEAHVTLVKGNPWARDGIARQGEKIRTENNREINLPSGTSYHTVDL